jgi:hypothetical protein
VFPTPAPIFQTPTLAKPFTAKIAASGIAVVTVTHSLHGLSWIVYQIGFALGQAAPSPQVAAHFNGVPLTATVTMQVSAFASIASQSPYAMESFFVGPPYANLEAGDMLVCAVTGANSGDTFTVGAYINEMPSLAAQGAVANTGYQSAFIPRPKSGTARFPQGGQWR